MSQFPDYYSILNLGKSATQEQVRQAYRKESLNRTHPDRLVNASSAEVRQATERFQAVADAYYVLSNPDRRQEYDNLYKTRADRTTDPQSSSNFFSQFSSMFGGSASNRPNTSQPDPNGVFTDVFDELLRPEVERRVPVWGWLGAICGAGIGFIVANFPGLLVGAFAGNRLGAVRDAKGKSIAAVFNELGGQQKAEILRALAAKVLGSAF
ncbi:DnaJ domain-containing protein [Gymnopilus junonius]|uniref:DnaJ domain-containing protein n=1 Tax=Gymnopilus junonius TaxID=109634 RepID=A0A9P5P1Q3_GYMJU|nr:DnaJ domain-containing protein [Gymnopilus junonius]